LCDGACILTDARRPWPILPPPHTTHNPQVLSNALWGQIAQQSGDQYVVLKTSTALVRFCILLEITSGLLLNRTYRHTPRYVRGHTTTNQHTPECTCPWERQTREKQERETRDQDIKRYKAYIHR
jgi:hypothetical protein